MNPYFIIAMLVFVAGVGLGGFQVGVKYERGNEADKKEAIAEAVDAANAAWAQNVATIKVTNKTIQNEVQREVQTHTVYRDCKLTPDGLQLLNQVLEAGAKPAGGGKLPALDEINRRLDGLITPKTQ